METILNIYHFSFFIINLTHTEISFSGRDFGYGRNGVMVTPSFIDKRALGFFLIRRVRCGVSNIDPTAFDLFVRNSVVHFNRYTYNLFTRNCRHYSEYLLIELAPNNSEEGIINNRGIQHLVKFLSHGYTPPIQTHFHHDRSCLERNWYIYQKSFASLFLDFHGDSTSIRD